MKNRVLTLKRTLVALFALLWLTQVGWSQNNFIFAYNGPDTIFVDGNCDAFLDWGHPTSVTAQVSAPVPGCENLLSFEVVSIIDNNGNSYPVGTIPPVAPFNAGDIVTVLYRAEIDVCGTTEFFGFDIEFIDNIFPVINPADVPADVTVTCDVPMQPVVNATDNCGGTFPTTVTDDVMVVDNCAGASVVRIFTASDAAGNTVRDTQNITLLTNAGPQVSPSFLASIQDVTVSCDNVPPVVMLATTEIADECTAPTDVVILQNGTETSVMGTCPATNILTRTWMVEDECGLQFTTTQTIQVEDNSTPVITPRASNNVALQCSGFPATPEFIINNFAEDSLIVTDNCSAITWTNDYTALAGGTCAGEGNASVTYTATDGCNSTSITINFMVEDTNPPNIVIIGGQDVTVECDGAGNITDLDAWLASDGNSMASDACSPNNLIVKSIEVISDPTTNDPYLALQNSINAGCMGGFVGTITVEFTFTDDCGNASTTDADFTILDTGEPTFTTPASDTSVECDGMGNVGGLTNWLNANGNAVAEDICSGTTVTWRTDPANPVVAFTCGNAGSVTVDFYATDACGRETTLPTTATFTIEDSQLPTWTTPPAPLTIECDGTTDPSGQIATWLANNGGGTATDACNAGFVTYTNDYAGLVNVFCGATGSATVKFTATDGCGGNAADRFATITIEDTTPPVWTANPSNLVVECGATNNPSGLISGWLASAGTTGAAMDVCGGPVTNFANDYMGLSDLCGTTGTATVTFTAFDDCGLTSTRTATVTVQDNTAPVFTTQAQALNIECNASTATAINDWLAANGNSVATESCGDITWAHDYVGYSAVCPGAGTATVTFTATDDCGNVATTVGTISVSDTQLPFFTIPPMNKVVQCDTFLMSDFTDWKNDHGGARASDDCSMIDNSSTSANWTFTEVFNPDCGPTGMYTVDFVVTDDCGFSRNRSANFTIIDNISPLLQPTSSDFTEECGGASDQAALNAWIDNHGGAVSTDGCSNVTWTNFDFLTTDPFGGAQGIAIAFGDYGNYPIVTANDCDWSVEVQFRVSDDCNNTSTTTSSFFISDMTDPVLSAAPADVTVDCAAPMPTILTATDNCDNMVDIVLVADTVSTCANSYVLTRTWTATDDCGNEDTETRTITVIDNTPPTVIAPASVTVECDNVPMAGMPTITDICDTNPTVVLVADTVFNGCVNNFVMTRTWTATDACGNVASASQVVTVQDNTPPTITGTLPGDLTVECDAIPAPAVAGTDIVGADNCGLQAFDYLQNTTQSNDTDACGFYNYTLTRTWTAIDLCGLTTVHTQIITVEDNNAPTFTRPADIAVDCQSLNDLTVTGNVTNVMDDCDASPTVSSVDVITAPGSCPQNYTLERTWTVTDACGNSVSDVQTISIQDMSAPTFDTAPQDMTMSCTDNISADAAYADWINTNGGGIATDLCGTVTWFALEPGTYTLNDPTTFTTPPAGLNAASCPTAVPGVYRMDEVSFVATDECGNAIDQTVTFTLTDNTPPAFVSCPIDVTLDTDPGDCVAALPLNPPLIIDECGTNNSTVNVTVMEPFTSTNPGDDQTIVNPITLDIGPLPTNPTVANDPVTLIIDLADYDGEDASEFFYIVGENGTQLGQTVNSATQCGSSMTTLTLTGSQVNAWASNDGFVTITLEPNVTANPIFAINDLCPTGSTATARLNYTAATPSGLTYEYNINNGSRIQVTPGTIVPFEFPSGNTLVSYFATDCAGNQSVCSYTVTVVDNELPTMSCPSDLTVALPATADCAAGAAVDLVPPTNIFDNCGFQNIFSQVQPQNTNAQLLTFSYNPNYLDYVADDKAFNFFGTGANAVNGNVTFTVRVEGDVEDADEYFEIFGEDGNLIGTTQAGQANVVVTPGTCPDLSVSMTTITVPVATFNLWAVDGQVSVTAVSNINFSSPPPGVMGDGISPACTTFASGTADGTTDGVSNMTIILDYTSVAPTYFASGATSIPNSIFPVPLAPVTHNFNIGVTTITYQIEDVNGNVNTCTYDITIEDNTAPSAVCQGVTIFVNPDGAPYILDPTEVDGGSFDNCGIASMSVSPNSFDCDDYGTSTNVVLQVTDESGNISSCVAPVNVQPIQLSPSFSIGLCGDENLNLFTNAPAGNYTYVWSGPNGFVSFQENPVIANANPTYSGSYVVTITGQSGCTANGAVTISISSAPNTPIVTVEDNDICSNEDIELSTQSYSGTVVNYSWYAGVSPTGTLLATTQVPTFFISNPAAGNYTYYVVVEVDACESNPSGAVSVNVEDSPTITGITNTQVDCASGDEDMFITPTVTPANSNYIYQWVGPNGFFSTSPIATLPDVSSDDNGSYTLTVINGVGGCASNPFTHVISVDDLPTTPVITTLDNQLCEGDLLQLQLVNNPYIGANISYTWNTPGQGTVTTTNASLTINSTTTNDAGEYSLSVTVDGCTSDVSGDFAVNVSSIPTAPAVTYNGPVCEGTTLELTTDFVAGASYFWTGPNNFNSTNQNPVIFPVDATYEGTYFLSVVVNGCPSPSSAPLLVEVNDAPEAVIATSNGSVCLGDPMATLELSVTSGSAVPGATYTWYDANTNSIVAGPTTSLTSTITDLTTFSAGNNEFYVVANVSACPSAASVPTLVVFDAIPANGAFAGNDIFVCDNSSVVLSAQAPSVGTGQWTQTAGTTIVIANPNQAATSITGLVSGETYSFAWTLSNGSCENYSSDEVVVTVDVAVATADAGTDFELCNATSANLNATPVAGGITGTWTQPSSQALLGVNIANVNDPNTAVTGLMPGNNYQFIWTLSNGGCGEFSSDIVVLTSGSTNGITAFAGADVELCGDEETALVATSPPAGSVGLWTSPTAGVTILAPSQSSTFVTDLQAGENVFIWTLSNSVCGEFSSDEVVVFYEATPQANDDSYDISYNGDLELDVLANDDLPSGYTLSFTNPTNGTVTENNGVFTYTSNIVFVGDDEFIYEICSDICPTECSTATVRLSVGADADCQIPTIFSPNNDGVNDEFIVPCLSGDLNPNNEVSIFNQWGDEVFRSKPYNNDWKGTYKGEDLPTGTYFYIVDLGDGNTPLSGFLVLER